MFLNLQNKKLVKFCQAIINGLVAFILVLSLSSVWVDAVPSAYHAYIFSVVVLFWYVALQALTTYIYHRYFIRAKHIFFSEQPLIFSPQTTETLKKWHSDVIKYLHQSEALKNPVIFLYDWHRKRYVHVFTENIKSFQGNHALAYITRQQMLKVIDAAAISDLPEVIGLDIQLLLNQYQVNAAIPLGLSTTSVCGFIFGNKHKLTIKEIELVQRHYGQLLEQILQHEALISQQPGKELSTPTSKQGISWPIGVTILAFILLTILWILTPIVKMISGESFVVNFTNIYGIMAVWGGVWGLIAAYQWNKKKNINRALRMFAIGLFLQEFGQIMYLIYYLIGKAVYPSIGDIGFFGSIPFYILGIIFLAKACGIDLQLKAYKNKVIALLIPFIMLLIGYGLFLQDYIFDFSNPLKIILDFGYPLAQAIYVSLAILTYLLTRDSGGKMKNLILFILFTLIWQFICDYTFLYQAYHNTWLPNGINDYMYFVSYFLMSSILIFFNLTRLELKNLSSLHQHL